ncbi:hypothetical protein [Nonomuraea sp. NPDC002799]
MQFTSGGTEGPRLDTAAAELLHLGDNVYGSLPSVSSARQAAEAFHQAGWRVRRSSETEYEVEHTFAELNLSPLEPVTFAGFVDPGRIDALHAALSALGLPYEVEFEAPDRTYGRDEGT